MHRFKGPQRARPGATKWRSRDRLFGLLGLLFLSSSGAFAQSESGFSGPLNLRTCFAIASRENPSVAAAKYRIRESHFRTASRRGDQRPTLDVLDEHQATNRDFPAFFNVPSYSHQLAARFQHRLYAGGTRKALVQEGRAATDEAEAEYRRVLEATLGRVANAYLDILEQEKTQATLSEAIKTQNRRIQDIQARIDAGILLETDRLQAEITRMENERRLLVSETSEALARKTLAILLNRPRAALPELGKDVGLLDQIEIAPLLVDPDLAEAPELVSIQARRDRFRSLVAAAKGDFRPKVDVQVSQKKILNGLSFSSQDANYAEAYGAVTLPVFDGGKRRAELHKAREALKALENEAKMLENELELRAGRSILGIQEAEKRLAASQRRVELTAENRRIVQDRYLEGAAIQAEILDADVEWRQARLEEITARFSVFRNLVELLGLTGKLTRFGLFGPAAVQAEGP